MKDRDAWDMIKGNGCEAKPLTKILDEMGFDKESYMVVRRHGPELKVASSRDSNGSLQEDEFLSFGGERRKPKNNDKSDFEAIDNQMTMYSQRHNEGKCINGMTGSNNGIYSAMANDGNEFIITEDPAIIEELNKQMGFKDGLSVPLSNGGQIMDFSRNEEWKKVQYRSNLAKVGRAQGITPRPEHIVSPKNKTSSNSASMETSRSR